MRSKIKRFDETVLFSVQRNQTRKLSITMLAFSLIGNGGLLWAFIGGLLLLDSSTSRYGAYLIVSLSLCALVNNIFFKSLCDRERPCDTYQNIPLLIKRPIGSSFPSGHTATSFASATALFFMDPRIGVIALFIAFLIAFSRLYLFVHYPTDILFGMVSGVALSLVGVQIVKIFFHFVPIAYFALP
ncbi:MAG: phosphatase PAP2 family protein [Clostridiales bacterium]|nr:phosphatase PAP2 family protein [Clostridiales bacterium]